MEGDSRSFGGSCVIDEISEILPDLRTTVRESVTDIEEEPPVSAEQTEAYDKPGTFASKERRRYEQVGVLGSGGLGEVLEVRDNDLLRLVALKRPKESRKGSSAAARLVLEAQVTAQLDHPNVPAVHELGVGDDGRPFFVMAKIEGQSLKELLELRNTDPLVQQSLNLQRALRLVLQVGYALAYAHERGVIHRDVKPENVIVGAFGQVYLMDWGIAKVKGRAEDVAAGQVSEQRPKPVDAVPFETRVNGFLGSVAYAAPEQIRGLPDIDGRVDVYSLAALLYTILAGRPPVVGESVHAVAAAAVLGEVTPLRSVAAVPEQVAAIVHRGLAANREERYPTIRAMIDDIEAVLEGRPIAALQETQMERFTRWYFARPPFLFRMRTIDVDLLGAAWGTCGAAVGIWMARHLSWASWGPLPWVLFALFVVVGARPFYTMLRKSRPDDPDALHVVGDLSAVSSVTLDHPADRRSTTGDLPRQ